jgi:hypothetical protein
MLLLHTDRRIRAEALSLLVLQRDSRRRLAEPADSADHLSLSQEGDER